MVERERNVTFSGTKWGLNMLLGPEVLRLFEERGRALTVIPSLTEPQVNRSASFLCYRRKMGTIERAAS
jgi:hypothetical protein